jgi:hypothetical protein
MGIYKYYIPIIPLKGPKREKLEVQGGYLRVFRIDEFSVNRWKFRGVSEVSPTKYYTLICHPDPILPFVFTIPR